MNNENIEIPTTTEENLKIDHSDVYPSTYQSTDSNIFINNNNNNNNSYYNKKSSVTSLQDGLMDSENYMETQFQEKQHLFGSRHNDVELLLPTPEEIEKAMVDSYVELSETECSILEFKEYDYQRGAGWPSGILIMANVCLGMGILNFPRIFYEAGGILITFVCLGIFVLLIAGSLYIIAYCCRYYACVNYQDMVRVHCGRTFGIVCSVALFFELTGSLIVKMVVLSDQLNRLYSIIANETFSNHYYLMPVVASVTFLPMCFIKDFSCFKYVSGGGVLAALYITFGVALSGYFLEKSPTKELYIETRDQMRDFNLLIPLLVYGYHGHVEAPLVFSGIKKQKLHNFMKTVYSYLFISTLCYSVTGVFGYLTFGKNTDDDVLLNYSTNNWFANAAILIVSFKLFTSFPVLFFVVRTVFSGFYSNFVNKLPQTKFKDILENFTVARVVQTLLIFYFVILFAVLIPNISNAISLIGAVSCHFCFTFPGLCFFCLYEKATTSNRKHFLRKLSGIFYILLGMFCFGVNFTVAIQRLIQGKHSV